MYALSYMIKMSPCKGNSPLGYFDYTIYALEGIWDVYDNAKPFFELWCLKLKPEAVNSRF